jgi:NADH:ubiquinone oxidoreductase subunit B-like Fe-S oxidoreductase
MESRAMSWIDLLLAVLTVACGAVELAQAFAFACEFDDFLLSLLGE